MAMALSSKLELLGIVVIVAAVIGTSGAFIAGQRRVDVTRCAGGPPEEKTDLAKYRKRIAECEQFYSKGSP